MPEAGKLNRRAADLESELRSGSSFEQVLGGRLLDDDRAEAIVALAKVTRRPADLVRWLSSKVRERNDWRRAPLVERCWRASAARDDAGAREATAEALLVALAAGIEGATGVRYSGLDPRVRQRAIRTLAGLGPPVVDRLVAALPDRLGTGAGAADALGTIGDARAVGRFRVKIKDDESVFENKLLNDILAFPEAATLQVGEGEAEEQRRVARAEVEDHRAVGAGMDQQAPALPGRTRRVSGAAGCRRRHQEVARGVAVPLAGRRQPPAVGQGSTERTGSAVLLA